MLEPFLSSGFVLKSQATRDYIDRLDDDVMVGSSPSEQSLLRFEKVSNYRVCFKADNGKYLIREDNNWIQASNETSEENSIFRVYNNDGKLSIKTHTGKFVTRCCGSNVIFNAGQHVINVWTHFSVEVHNVTSGIYIENKMYTMK